jgi:hypothetical protein
MDAGDRVSAWPPSSGSNSLLSSGFRQALIGLAYQPGPRERATERRPGNGLGRLQNCAQNRLKPGLVCTYAQQ